MPAGSMGHNYLMNSLREEAAQTHNGRERMITGKVASLRKDRTGFKMDNEAWFKVAGPDQCPGNGDTIQFEISHADGRDNFAGPITVTEKAPPWNVSGGSTGAAKKGVKSGYDNLGQQIGNAVTNATNLHCYGIAKAAEGALVTSIVSLAYQLVKAGDQVRAMHEAGAVDVPVQQPAQQHQQNLALQPSFQVGQQPAGGLEQAKPEFDDDLIPF